MKPRMHYLDTVLDFGKWEGFTVLDILEDEVECQYILWAILNIPEFFVSVDICLKLDLNHLLPEDQREEVALYFRLKSCYMPWHIACNEINRSEAIEEALMESGDYDWDNDPAYEDHEEDSYFICINMVNPYRLDYEIKAYKEGCTEDYVKRLKRVKNQYY